MIEHAVLARRLAWLSSAYGVTREDRTALATQATFDPSLIGCACHWSWRRQPLAPPGQIYYRGRWPTSLRQGATIMAFVPSTLAGFLDALAGRGGLRLRVACCGGEILNPELARRYLTLTNARLFNVYGPTETCIFASAWLCERGDAGPVLPIGKPVDDTCIYVLDQRLHPLPDGVAGEVFIGGDGLARGYLERPELAEAVFLANLIGAVRSACCRTGDRGCGRRGLSAPPGQARPAGQARLPDRLRCADQGGVLAFEGIAQAAAKLVESDGRKAIHAWIAPASDEDHERVQRALRVRCRAMLPSVIDFPRSALPVSNVTRSTPSCTELAACHHGGGGDRQTGAEDGAVGPGRRARTQAVVGTGQLFRCGR